MKKTSIKKPSKTDTIKKKLLIQLEKSLGNITIACQNTGIVRNTYYDYMNKDKSFKKQVDDIQEMAIDYTENQLFNLIKDQNPTAILFYLKTKGKHRGYIEKQEIESKNENTNKVTIEVKNKANIEKLIKELD